MSRVQYPELVVFFKGLFKPPMPDIQSLFTWNWEKCVKESENEKT